MSIRVRINVKNYKAYHLHHGRLGTAPRIPNTDSSGACYGTVQKRCSNIIRTLSRLSKRLISKI